MQSSAILVTLVLALAATLHVAAASPAEAEEFVLPLDLSGGRPAVSLSVGDRPAELWIFDTGAMGTAVDIERARAWGLPNLGVARVGSPIGGTPLEGFRTTLTEVRVGDAALPEAGAVAMPMPAHLERAGVLSPNLFNGSLVRFDFARAEARVLERTEANMPRVETTPYSSPHPLPAIAVHLPNGDAFSAHLDTGAPRGLTLPYALAATLPLAGPLEERGRARFLDGERTVYRGRIVGEVRVGPLLLTDPEVDFIDGLPVGNIGMELLQRMRLTLDPERRVAWAELAAP